MKTSFASFALMFLVFLSGCSVNINLKDQQESNLYHYPKINTEESELKFLNLKERVGTLSHDNLLPSEHYHAYLIVTQKNKIIAQDYQNIIDGEIIFLNPNKPFEQVSNQFKNTKNFFSSMRIKQNLYTSIDYSYYTIERIKNQNSLLSIPVKKEINVFFIPINNECMFQHMKQSGDYNEYFIYCSGVKVNNLNALFP